MVAGAVPCSRHCLVGSRCQPGRRRGQPGHGMTGETEVPQPALVVENLGIDYKIGTDWVTAVRDINFTIERGQTFGLVGESGCGKSTVAMAIMHYLPRNGRIGQGSI